MKLATLKDGSRDGRLVVVSRDLTRCTDASFLTPTLQAALDDWRRIAPHLAALAQSLELGAVPWIRFHEHDAHSPLPRAYQHVGYGDSFEGPREPIEVDGDGAVTVTATAAVVTGDISRNADAEEVRDGIELVMLAAGSAGSSGGAGTVAFSPVAVTPDEFGATWSGNLDQPIHVTINGKPTAPQAAGGCIAAVATALRFRPLSAGAIVSAGGASPSHALKVGDIVRVEMKDAAGHSIFGAIEQTVAAFDRP